MTIQIAKKPATIAMIAATPPFATNEPAADEAVEEEAGEVAVAVAEPAPAVPERVNGIILGVAVPVALRLPVSR